MASYNQVPLGQTSISIVIPFPTLTVGSNPTNPVTRTSVTLSRSNESSLSSPTSIPVTFPEAPWTYPTIQPRWRRGGRRVGS